MGAQAAENNLFDSGCDFLAAAVAAAAAEKPGDLDFLFHQTTNVKDLNKMLEQTRKVSL